VPDHIIDFMFLIDIFITFNTEYMGENYEIETNRKKISINYLKGWFTIDIVSIIPFDEFLTSSKYNKLARVARVGRL